jgi:hypothetical protein
VLEHIESQNDSVKKLVSDHLNVIRRQLSFESYKPGFEKIDLQEVLTPENYSKLIGGGLNNYFDDYQNNYQKIYNEFVSLVEKKMAFYEKSGYNINEEKNRYFNESLADLVKNVNTKNRLIEYKGELIQQINPIFQEPKPASIFDYRTAFFLPEKNLLGMRMSTYKFDLLVIWIMSIFFYVTLYFELLRKFVGVFGKVNIRIKK